MKNLQVMNCLREQLGKKKLYDQINKPDGEILGKKNI